MKSNVERAFEAAAFAIKGGLTRAEFAELALRCIDEAASYGDRTTIITHHVQELRCWGARDDH